MEVEQTQSFNQKLSQWIASQGFWFQLRHSMSGGGGWAMTMSHLVRLGFKILIALVVASGGFGIYLVKRIGSEPFINSLNVGLEDGLKASEAKILDFSRVQGDAQIRRIGAEGGKESFFHSLDAGNVRFRMGLLSGMAGSWDAGALVAKSMDINVKAGAETPAEAKAAGAAFFQDWAGFRFSSVHVDEATVRWGYSARTWGKIEKSQMTATRSGDGWHLLFSGGTFSQNWLKGLEIVELKMECTPGSVRVTKGEFKAGNGTVVLKDVQVKGGDRPALSGTVEATKVALTHFIPESAQAFVEGVVSGEFQISGSTNSTDGVQFEGDVALDNANIISLRERFHLLKALSVVDLYNSYRKVDLNRGGFHLKTGGGKMELSRVDVRSEDLMTLQGRLKATVPEEDTQPQPLGSGVFSQIPNSVQNAEEDGKKDSLTLEKAGAAAAEKDTEEAIFKRFADSARKRDSLHQVSGRSAQTIRYDGGFRISIPGDAFDSTEVLRQTYPVDPGNGRIAFDVPVQGTIYEVTGRQADELLNLGSKR
ncbi:hypothetical protein OJ996_10320 [Luteolibacter sp. GHJ8]|uniref:AsmA-like protein n=1 Tax=Luteolibacter rhizosphaerae TaxID=2989719 RepID=A0ABT3G2B2_9BACT|nr:hypothetical protein [Luteolibacter rhizosphaerae]MCW1913972.1 hypothetical protein [Luteolibacter rhizosphaerae]